MPNLVGLWTPAANDGAIRAAIARQLDRVRVPGIRYAEYSAIFRGVGMGLLDHGHLENGPQPARSADGAASLFLDGELYNADELKRQYRAELPNKNLSTPELCLALIQKFGDDIVDRFNGLFCIALFDEASRSLKLISDRLGFRPLFYAIRDETVIFGTELKAVCAGDPGTRAIDDVGLLEFFVYGSHVMNRTSLAGYRRLAPATVMTIDRDGARTRKYWSYKYDEGAGRLDQRSYVSVYHTLLDRAVERNMRGGKRIGMFLSGGYDSRAVAAAVRPHHLPIPTFTFGDPASRDIRYAAMLADRLGMGHQPLTGDAPHLYDVVREVV